jgi:hypothetical protein
MKYYYHITDSNKVSQIQPQFTTQQLGSTPLVSGGGASCGCLILACRLPSDDADDSSCAQSVYPPVAPLDEATYSNSDHLNMLARSQADHLNVVNEHVADTNLPGISVMYDAWILIRPHLSVRPTPFALCQHSSV